MSHDEIMQQLKELGTESTKIVLRNHGAKEPFYGVKVGDLKKIVKKVKKNHELALSLYATNNSDAMYLAGLVADETRISKQELQQWVTQAYWYFLSTYTVAHLAAETPFGVELALEWMQSDQEQIEAAGWSTLSAMCGLKPDESLDLELLENKLLVVKQSIHEQKNRVRYAMNNFVIAVGSYVVPLSGMALEVGNHIGKVSVEMGDTACKVSLASYAIQKVLDKGFVGKKRKTFR